MKRPEREIDKLFELPLDEFTRARNELAKRLAKDGEKEAADEVKALAKPSVPVWAINQLARRDKAGVRAVLDAGAKLRRAQERALAGGNSDALRSAQRDEREAVRELAQRATEILREAGRPAGRPVLERISGTLGAAAISADARDALKAGRLTEELKVSGFESLAGIAAPARRTAGPPDELAERRRRKAEREQERRRLEKRARELARKAEAAEDEARRAEDAASKARVAADEAQDAADAAATELEQFDK